MKKLRDWGIFGKIIGLSLITWLLLVLASFTLLTPYIRSLIMHEKQTAVHELVQQATSMLTSYQKQIESGALTREEAMKRASERIASIRYDNGNNYLWINDLGPKMVMHPLRPELNGTDLTDNKDPNGKALFVEMVAVCKDKGKGFVHYAWGKPGNNTPVPKLSYVELYQPWGWIIGTGIYIDDVDAAMRKIQFSIGGGPADYPGTHVPAGLAGCPLCYRADQRGG